MIGVSTSRAHSEGSCQLESEPVFHTRDTRYLRPPRIGAFRALATPCYWVPREYKPHQYSSHNYSLARFSNPIAGGSPSSDGSRVRLLHQDGAGLAPSDLVTETVLPERSGRGTPSEREDVPPLKRAESLRLSRRVRGSGVTLRPPDAVCPPDTRSAYPVRSGPDRSIRCGRSCWR